MTFACGDNFVGFNTFGTFLCEIRVHLGSAFDCVPITINSGLSHPYQMCCLETYSWSRLWEIKSVTCCCRQPHHNQTHKCTKIHQGTSRCPAFTISFGRLAPWSPTTTCHTSASHLFLWSCWRSFFTCAPAWVTLLDRNHQYSRWP